MIIITLCVKECKAGATWEEWVQKPVWSLSLSKHGNWDIDPLTKTSIRSPRLQNWRHILDSCMYLITTPFGNYSYDCHLGPWKTDSRLDERDPKEQNAIFCSRSFLDSLSYKRTISRPWFIQLPLFFFVPFRSLMIWSKEVQATWYDGSGHSELMCSRLKSEWANLLPVQHPTEISLSGSHRDRCTHFRLKIARCFLRK